MNIDNNTNQYIGQAIRSFRKLHDYTLADLSIKLNISYQQLQKYEKGTNRVGADMLYEISKVFDADMQSFFPSFKKAKPLSKEVMHISKSLDAINDDELSGMLASLTTKIQNLAT